MMTHNKILILGTLIALLGCTKAPALKVYSLNVPDIQITKNHHYSTKTIKVTFPQSLREQMSQKMNFSYSNNDHGSYQNSEWSNNMSKLLQGTFIEVLENSRLFKAVLSDTTTLKTNYRLESNVFAFEHRVRGTQSHAVISIQFTLINADTGKLVKSKRFSYSEATPGINAQGYAEASNVAIDKLSKDLIKWLG